MKVESSQLQQVYARFPSLKVNADKGALEAAAVKVLGAPAAKALISKLLDKNTYLSARTEALSVTLKASGGEQLQQPRKAVVSGLSTGGLMSAIVLAKAGYKVDAFEAREGYTRQIQFSSRQALIDELASIDPALSQRFLEISSPMTKGFVFTLNDQRTVVPREAPRAGDATAVPKTGEEMLSGVPISIVECRVLEQVLFDYLKAQPNVTVHSKSRLQLRPPDAQGRYAVEGVGVPDLVVVSEGASSATRKALGIESMATSPTERIIAGVVGKGSGGRAALKLEDSKRSDGTTERILSVALGSAKLDKTWVLAEVPESFNADPGAGLDPTSDAYRRAQQALIEKEFRAEAALVMETDVSDAPLEGATAGTSRPTLFTMQQHMSNKATAGSNVVGLGDFVGNAHFTVGGGMATAAVSHVERLKALVFDLELGVDRGAALKRYDQGALEDTLAWGQRGIAEFYPDVDSKVASEAYLTAVGEWLEGKNKDPLAALEKLLTPVSEALPAIGKAA